MFNNSQNQANEGALYMSRFGLKTLFEQKGQHQQVQIPCFLENISKDIMTNRKIKIFLAKSNNLFI
jgi:hypothetical protein